MQALRLYWRRARKQASKQARELGQAERLDVESREGLEAAVRHLLVAALLGIFFMCSRAGNGFVDSPYSTGQQSAPVQLDISRSGRDFLEVWTSVDSVGGVGREKGVDNERNKDASRVERDATRLGSAAGF